MGLKYSEYVESKGTLTLYASAATKRLNDFTYLLGPSKNLRGEHGWHQVAVIVISTVDYSYNTVS